MREWTARAYAVKITQGGTSWNISWASLRIVHEQCSACTTKHGSDNFRTHLIPPHQRFSIKFVCMHGYSWTCVYFFLLQVQRCLMHMSKVFSCSQAIMLLASLQLYQLPQPINNAVCAINIDDAASRTVDIHAVATIAASPYLQMLHPLLRITVVSTCCGHYAASTCCGYYAASICHAATAVVFVHFCGPGLDFHCCGLWQLSPPAIDSSVI